MTNCLLRFVRSMMGPRALASLVMSACVFLLVALTACGRTPLDDGSDPNADSSSDGPPGDSETGRTVATLEVDPATLTLPAGTHASLIARALYTDGTTGDVTSAAAWSSDNPSIASVDATGKVTAIASGKAHVRATMGTAFAEAVVTVPSSSLTSLRIDPPSAKVGVGSTVAFSATATYSDGTFSDATAIAAWSVDAGGIAKVTAGNATGIAAGSTTVRASLGAVSGSATLEVTTSALARIDVTPTLPTIAASEMVAMKATGVYADGTTGDLTLSASWSSSDVSIATVATGSALAGDTTGVTPGVASISASYGGLSGSTTVKVTAAKITSIVVAPASVTIPIAGVTSFTATAHFADGSSGDVTASSIWSSADVTVAVVSTGNVSGLAAGTTTITASFGGFSGTATVNVAAKKLVSISISPPAPTVPKGTTLGLTATGTYDDGSTLDITADVFWSTDDGGIASVSNAPGASGKVTPIAVGTTMVHATLAGISGSTLLTVSSAAVTSIAIAPNPIALSVGGTVPAKATATFADGTVIDVTTSCLWSSADAAVATASNAVGSQGSITGVAAGSTTIRCTLAGVTGSATAIVSGGTTTLVSIAVTPSTSTLPLGGSLALKATGTYSDGSTADITTSVTWSSSNAGVATVDAGGMVSGKAGGTVTMTAALGAISGTATVTVTSAPLVDLIIDPSIGKTTVGGSVTFTATAVFADGSKSDVTATTAWSTDDATVATVASGIATGIGAGSTTVRGSFAGLARSAKITVVAAPPTLSKIEVDPTSPTIGVGATVPFTATAIYVDGTKSDVTMSATWSSSAPAVLSVVSGGASSGLGKGVSPGTVVVSATFSGLTGTTSATVTPASVSGITVTPATTTLAIGNVVVLKATATYSDGTLVDVTSSATWSSSDTTIVTASGSTATAVNTGVATVSATFSGVTGSATITVSAAKLLTITIVPASASVPLGGTFGFKAIGTYEGGSTRDITVDVLWTTDDSTIATIGNGLSSAGQVTPVAAGKTTARAALSGLSASASLQIDAAIVKSIVITPASTTMVQGTSQLLKATAKYSDGTSGDVTTTCLWSTGDATVATVSNGSGTQGRLTGVGVGSTTVACTQSGVTGSASVTVTSPTLSSINVSPVAPFCHLGDVLQFSAVAIALDGTSSNVTFASVWSSADPTVVKWLGTAGRFQCVGKGKVNVSASYGGKTGWTPVTVSDATIVSMQVDPVGTTIAVGWSQQFIATVIFSDGTSQNVTGAATWVSTNTTAAQVNDAGLKGRATGLATGSTSIQATYKGLSASTSLTVSSATVKSISIFPATKTAAVGTVWNFQASVIYSDGTSKDITGLATWTSSNVAVVQVSDGIGRGQATALSPGTVTISAIYGGVTGTAPVTVTSATLTSVEVTPFTASAAVGTPVYFRAAAIYSDGTKGDVTTIATWISSDPSVASVSNAYWWTRGRTTTIAPGTAKISATYLGKTGVSSITVTSATLSKVQITPFNPSLPVGFGTQLVATGIYSDGTTANLTGLATWSSSSPSIAAVSNVWPSWGRVTPLSMGTATISATWLGVTGTNLITVTSATVSSITITPNPATIAVKGTQQLTATATFTDGTTLNITGAVTWLTSDATIADVSNGVSRGQAYGFSTGSVTVKAIYGSVTGTSTVMVK